MTDATQLIKCLDAGVHVLDVLIQETSAQAHQERVQSHAKHPDAAVTQSLSELVSIRTQLKLLAIRVRTVGR